MENKNDMMDALIELRKHMDKLTKKNWYNSENVKNNYSVGYIVEHILQLIDYFEQNEDGSFIKRELDDCFWNFYERFRQLIVLMNEFPEEDQEKIESLAEYIYYQFRNMTRDIHNLLQDYDWSSHRKKEVFHSVVQNEGNTFRTFDSIFLRKNTLEQNNSLMESKSYQNFILLNYLKRIYGKWFISFNPIFDFGCLGEAYQQELMDKVYEISMWSVQAKKNLLFNFALIDSKRDKMEKIGNKTENNVKEYHNLCFLSGETVEMILQNMLHQWYIYDSEKILKKQIIYTGGAEEVAYSEFENLVDELWKDAMYMIFIVQLYEYKMGELYSKKYLKDRSKKIQKNKEEMKQECLKAYFEINGITDEIIQGDEEEKIGPEIVELLESTFFKDIRNDEGDFCCSKNEMAVIRAIMHREGEAETRRKEADKDEYKSKEVNLREFLLRACNLKEDEKFTDGFYHEMFRGSAGKKTNLRFENVERYNDDVFLEAEYWDSYTCEFMIDGIYFGLLDAGALKWFPAVNDKNKIPELQESIRAVLNVLEKIEITNMGKAIILYQIFYYAGLLIDKLHLEEKMDEEKDKNNKRDRAVGVFGSLSKIAQDFPMEDISQAYDWINHEKKGKKKEDSKIEDSEIKDSVTKDRMKQINEYYIRRCCECRIDVSIRNKESTYYKQIVEAVYGHRFALDDMTNEY